MDLTALAEIETELLTSFLPLDLGENCGQMEPQDVVLVHGPSSGQTMFMYQTIAAATDAPVLSVGAAVTPETKHKNPSPSASSSENISFGNANESRRYKHKSQRKRRVVVSPRTKHGNGRGGSGSKRKLYKLRSSSSSFAATSSPTSNASPSPKRTKKRAGGRKLPPLDLSDELQDAGSRGGTTVARFQCRVCGLTRFLALGERSGPGLPSRSCECGSSAMVVSSWLRVARGPQSVLAGGGLGRECVHCPRCNRLYSGAANLRRHGCKRERRKAENPAEGSSVSKVAGVSEEWPGVSEVPTCPRCGASFIFDSLLERHVRREHRDPPAKPPPLHQ